MIRCSDIKSTCYIKLTFSQILNSISEIMLPSKRVVNTHAVIKNIFFSYAKVPKMSECSSVGENGREG